MKTNLLKSVIVSFFVFLAVQAFNQNIIIDEKLAANSEPMKVKIGASAFGKISKWKFGEYAVVSGKVGWTKTTTKSNFLNTKTESKSTHKFSFILCNKQGDSAIVNAAINIEYKALQESELLRGFYIGDDEIKLNIHNFTASITINRDTTNTWLLLINSEWGSESKNTGNAMLTDGTLKYLIFSASSNKDGTDKRVSS